MSKDKDNVTPMFPDIPRSSSIKATGLPYTTPSAAIEEVLKLNNFDTAVINKDWVELRIIAKFSDVGAIFHTVQARGVEMKITTPEGTPVDNPAHRVLVCMAGDNGLPEDYFYEKANIAQMDTLNAELADATDDELIILAAGDDNERLTLVEAKGWQKSNRILGILFNGLGS